MNRVLWLGLRLLRGRRTLAWITASVAFVLAAAGGLVMTVDTAGRISSSGLRLERAGTAPVLFEVLGPVPEWDRVEQLAEQIEEAGFGPAEPALVAADVPARGDSTTFPTMVSARDWAGRAFGMTLTVEQGQIPSGGGVVVTEEFARRANVSVGSAIDLGESQHTVSGVGHTPAYGPTSLAVFIGLEDMPSVGPPTRVWFVGSDPGSQAAGATLQSEAGLMPTPTDAITATGSPLDSRPIVLLGTSIVLAAAVLLVLRRATGKGWAASAEAARTAGVPGHIWRTAACVEALIPAMVGVFAGALVALGFGGVLGRLVADRQGFTYSGLGDTPARLVLLGTALVIMLGLAAALEARPSSNAATLAPTLKPRVSGLDGVIGRLVRSHPRRTWALGLTAAAGTFAMTVLGLSVATISASEQEAQASGWPPGGITLLLRGQDPPAPVEAEFEAIGAREPTTVWTAAPRAVIAMAGGDTCVLNAIDVDGDAWYNLTGRGLGPGERQALEAGAVVALRPVSASTGIISIDEQVQGQPLSLVSAPPGDSAEFDCLMSVDTLRDQGITPWPELLVSRTGGAIDPALRTRVSQLVEASGFPATDLRWGAPPPVRTPPVVEAIVIAAQIGMATLYCVSHLGTAWDDAPTYRLLRGLGMGRGATTILFLATTSGIVLAATAAGFVAGLPAALILMLAAGAPGVLVPPILVQAMVATVLASALVGGAAHLRWTDPG
ncbi:hypothetical protein CGZ91_01245 [Parenemella sanctibonifatiensis]|uniref:FtsX-like permease family protein n=2 Tax=Parenemella sanctibonifatiensis TaxID=2016505 RepID=A0A255EL02_9ACTN|nr:hypothetical protein CGZ91_01245 [Parenemella sanctibonifatiensis]